MAELLPVKIFIVNSGELKQITYVWPVTTSLTGLVVGRCIVKDKNKNIWLDNIFTTEIQSGIFNVANANGFPIGSRVTVIYTSI